MTEYILAGQEHVQDGESCQDCHGVSYTVTWSLQVSDDAGDTYVALHLRKNGQNNEESYHGSYFTGSSGLLYDECEYFISFNF